MNQIPISRRDFLKVSGLVASGSLFLGVNVGCESQKQNTSNNLMPNIWIRVSPDNTITVIVSESEMGQGTYTALPMLVAEELEVNWDKVLVERASVDPVYGYQFTGGSNSIRRGWGKLRLAAALTRELFIRAGALHFKVDKERCTAGQGYVITGDKKISYGELIPIADGLEIDEQVSLKNISEFSIIGKPVPRKDLVSKVNGTALFGMDIKLKDQLYSTVVHPPFIGAKLISYDPASITNMAGVIDVFSIDQGVAIVGKDTWTVFEAAKILAVEWSEQVECQDTETIIDKTRQLDENSRVKEETLGNVDEVFKSSNRIVKREYILPFQAHMTMETMNCTTHFKDDGDVEIWVPTQSPSGVYDVAKNIAQSKIERKLRQLKNDILGGYDDTINVNTTYLGGGFGRRLQHDYVSESVQISKRYKHPVQHVWSREEDLKQDYFHPLTLHDISVCLDDQGYPLAWHHIIKGGGVNAIGADHLYDIPNKKIEVLNGPEYLRKGSWRSVGAHYNVYVIEHLIDELALQSNYDPIEYRLNLLKNSSRLSKVIETVAELSGWSERANEEYIYGIAAARTFGSYVAEVVMLKKIKENGFKLHKVFCVVDCGVAVNPDIVKQQMEGGIIWGLTAATKSKITVNNCQVEQKNFYNYPIIRLDEVPSIEVHILKSSENPEGIGEPGVPPLAPAIANAVLNATGRSSYELPIRMS